MAINNSGDASNKKRVTRTTDYTHKNPGPYIGIVKDNVDPAGMGTLKVLIPSIGSSGEDGREGNLYTCQYLNPFYGVKSPAGVDPTDPASYESTQHSYGMWFTPPDIDSRVMVMFVEGRDSQAYWIGCIMDPYMNHMIPGIASTKNIFDEVEQSEGAVTPGVSQKEKTYGSDYLPAGEVNRSLFDAESTGRGFNQKKPIHPFAKTLRQQGLVSDTVRGTTSSSARRESPSNVYGISTPGPIKADSKKNSYVGSIDNQKRVKLTRDAGHTFVMDDGDANGNNRLTRLRTGSGHQILMHDTEGVIYIANGSGNAWMEFDKSGRIDVYSADSINLRSTTNFNIHSDAGINFYAKDKVKIRGKNGVVIDGKNIINYADKDIKNQATSGNVTTRAGESIFSYCDQNQHHNAQGRIDLSGGQVHFNTYSVSATATPLVLRTKYYAADGTNTLEEKFDDVNIVNKEYSVLSRTSGSNDTMTGMGQMPTHEPAIHANKVIRFYGVSTSANSNVVGTPEHIAQRNRNNELDVIRIGQAQADLEVYLRENFPNASQAVLQAESKKFIDGYNQRYGIPANLNLSFLTTGVSDAVQQVTEAITGKSVNLLKDQVFIKDAKVLYTSGNLGQTVQSTTKLFQDLSTGNVSTRTIGDVLGGSVKLPGGDIGIVLPTNLKNVPGVDKVTGTVKTVVGGTTTAITQVTSAINKATKTVIGSVGRVIGKLF